MLITELQEHEKLKIAKINEIIKERLRINLEVLTTELSHAMKLILQKEKIANLTQWCKEMQLRKDRNVSLFRCLSECYFI